MVNAGYSMIKLKVGVEGDTNPNRDVERISKVRQEIGPDIGTHARRQQLLGRCHRSQFRQPCRRPEAHVPRGARLRRRHPRTGTVPPSNRIPLATGEHEYSKWGVWDLLLKEAADIVQADGARAGGFTEKLKIAALTQAWNVKCAPRAMENCTSRLVAALQNSPFLERLLMFEEVTARVVPDAARPDGGFTTAPTQSGLGLEPDLDFVRSQKGN